eukprot:TRINITY_DN21005_c0_g1_i1.p1 TRINITY_DN21005_c0_g1~~TRINITY_DN21005_c0_g1_i1.p1  ORF type:complete len:633 (+),score=80.04 TRINITY_DN21005_c0_g1_i1:272-2170(+)
MPFRMPKKGRRVPKGDAPSVAAKEADPDSPAHPAPTPSAHRHVEDSTTPPSSPPTPSRPLSSPTLRPSLPSLSTLPSFNASRGSVASTPRSVATPRSLATPRDPSRGSSLFAFARHSLVRRILPGLAMILLVALAPMFLAFSGLLLGRGGSGYLPDSCVAYPNEPEDRSKVIGEAVKYFNDSDPAVLMYSRIIDQYLSPFSLVSLNQFWADNARHKKDSTHEDVLPKKRSKKKAGDTGTILPETRRHLARTFVIMSCCGQIRVVDGTVYFRYGGFYNIDYRLFRLLQTVRLIQDAVERFELLTLRTEFFLNTCDHPMSHYSSRWAGRAGFPIFSPFVSDDTMDILIPDAMDLHPMYTAPDKEKDTWDSKIPKAVFRGATTNFNVQEGNYGASPRIRLHRLTDVHPDLIDARVMRWSHIADDEVVSLGQEGVKRARSMNFSTVKTFKYQIVVDGGAGSSRVCGVLSSQQLLIRQESPMKEFHEPLLKENVHVLATSRTFTDLHDVVLWARNNDDKVQRIVQRANDVARIACTWKGRALYWGILLVKYSKLLKHAKRIKAPTNFCAEKPIVVAQDPPTPEVPSCLEPNVESYMAPCTYFCSRAPMPEAKFIWLKSDVLDDYVRVGPGQWEEEQQ